MATPTTTPLPSTSGSANTSTLSEWAGPYVTNMLGKAQAVADSPYQTYQGPLTAGASDIQQNLFKGVGNMNFPGNFGASFSSTDAYQLPQYGANGTTTGGGGGTDPTRAQGPDPGGSRSRIGYPRRGLQDSWCRDCGEM